MLLACCGSEKLLVCCGSEKSVGELLSEIGRDRIGRKPEGLESIRFRFRPPRRAPAYPRRSRHALGWLPEIWFAFRAKYETNINIVLYFGRAEILFTFRAKYETINIVLYLGRTVVWPGRWDGFALKDVYIYCKPVYDLLLRQHIIY